METFEGKPGQPLLCWQQTCFYSPFREQSAFTHIPCFLFTFQEHSLLTLPHNFLQTSWTSFFFLIQPNPTRQKQPRHQTTIMKRKKKEECFSSVLCEKCTVSPLIQTDRTAQQLRNGCNVRHCTGKVAAFPKHTTRIIFSSKVIRVHWEKKNCIIRIKISTKRIH